MPVTPSLRPATLRDVAAAAGVHLSTVSLALSGSPKIRPDTRARLTAIAERLHYRRDPVYFALSARRELARHPPPPPLITFITNRVDQAAFDEGVHMPAFLAGAQAQAHAMGFACELLLVGDQALSPAAIEQRLQARGTQGVILAAFMPDLRQLELDWSRYTVVKIDSSFMPPDVARISHDQHQILAVACQRLHALGYRRIGMAVGEFDEEGSQQHYSTAYRLQQHLLGLPALPPFHFRWRESEPTPSRRLVQWAKAHRLDGVISNFLNIRDLLETGGLPVPSKIACASLCLNAPDPKNAGLVMDHQTVGRKAVEMIALLIKTRQFGVPASAPSLFVEGRWCDGASAPAVLRNTEKSRKR